MKIEEILSFLSWSLVKRKGKRRDEKLFCLIEKKNEKIEKGKHVIFLLKICVRMNTSLKISTRSSRTKNIFFSIKKIDMKRNK